MYKITKLLLITIFVSVSSLSAYAAEQKLAFVDMNRAINQSDAGKKSRKVLEAKYNQSKQMLGLKEQEIRKEIESLRSSMMMSEQAKKQKQEKLQKMDMEFRAEKKRVERVFYNDQKKHTDRLLVEIQKIAQEIGKKEGYDMVMEATMRRMMLFSKSEIKDITDLIIKAYNRKKAGK